MLPCGDIKQTATVKLKSNTRLALIIHNIKNVCPHSWYH